VELSCLTPIVAQSVRFFDVSEKNAENTQKVGQNGRLVTFSGPWLAQASLWLTWATKKLSRAEVTSSPGRARLLLDEDAKSCYATSTPHFL